MTSTTLAPSAQAAPAARAASPVRTTFGGLVRAEWIGLTSLRGTIASLIIGMALVVLPAAGIAVMYGVQYRQTGDETMLQWIPSAAGLGFGGVFFAVAVAVLIGTGIYAKEHATGALRTQLAASPRRVSTLTAKALVVAIAVFCATVVAVLLATAAAAVVLPLFDLPVGIDDLAAEVILPAVGAGVFATSAAVFSLGVAAILRSETWTTTLTIVFLFVFPMVLLNLPWEWAASLSEILLGTTGQSLAATPLEVTGELGIDLALTIAWALAAFAGGAIAMRRRDA